MCILSLARSVPAQRHNGNHKPEVSGWSGRVQHIQECSPGVECYTRRMVLWGVGGWARVLVLGLGLVGSEGRPRGEKGEGRLGMEREDRMSRRPNLHHHFRHRIPHRAHIPSSATRLSPFSGSVHGSSVVSSPLQLDHTSSPAPSIPAQLHNDMHNPGASSELGPA